jgi:hypothetical protein
MDLAVADMMRCTLIFVLAIFSLVSCRSMRTHNELARYVVTAVPLDVGAGRRPLCVAIEPTASNGVWWWEPGESGCSERSTGPGIFHGDDAKVARRAQSATIDAHFRLPLIVRPDSTQASFADVNLTLENGFVQSATSGSRVAIENRHDLDVPERQ